MYSGKEGAFVLKMVRWHRQKKNNGNRKKRIASAVCMLGVLVVCLGVVGYRNKLKADEKLPVMTRGVVDQIEQGRAFVIKGRSQGQLIGFIGI